MAKKILITGKNSYIGLSLKKWLLKEPDKYIVDSISVREELWKQKDFSQYDIVFHAAGIAHIKENAENKKLYYKVNRDLAYKVAKKAKTEGVKQFIFLSSMSVYGLESGIIDRSTPLQPNNAYGKSKMEAEKLIHTLASESFFVAILRPPMVYGKGCKGNYPKLVNLALKTPVFPKVNNKRSMIYIDNLSELIKQLIDHGDNGLFFPQNTDYVNTSKMVRLISGSHNRRILFTKLFNPLLKVVNLDIINKVFGNLTYEKSMSIYNCEYRVVRFEDSIKRIERG